MRLRATVKGMLFALLAVAALVLAADEAAAQATGRITGVARAQSGRSLGGAQLFLQGTRIGALSTAEGRFLLLNVPSGDYVLQVELIGYGRTQQNVTVMAGETVTVDFNLAETAISLDEIVVTGTAADMRAKEVGNSLESITSREIQNLPVISAEQILQGRAPGVTVMSGGGQPGSGGGTIKLRGTSTTSTAPEPLLYIDGIRVYNLPQGSGGGSRTAINPIQDINPSDIERIEIIKGASATTIYGTEAAGGVIQVFTKRGISGAPMWTAEIRTGLAQLPRIGASSDPSELYTNCSDLANMFGLDVFNSDRSKRADKVFFEDPTCPSDGTWKENGIEQRYSLSVRGGFGDVTYFVSGAYNDIDGTLPTGGSKDGTIRGNFDFRPTDDLTVAMNTQYTRRQTDFVPDGNNSNGFLLNVGRGHNNYLKGGKGEDCANVSSDVLCITNGYLFEAQSNVRSDHFITGLTTQWAPTDQLTNRLSVGFDYVNNGNRFVRPFGNLRSPDGFLEDYNTNHTKLSVDYTGSFRNDVGDDLVSTLSWGGQIFRDKHRYTRIDVDGFAGPGFPTIQTGTDLTRRTDNQYTNTSAGFFFQEVVGFQDRLFVTAGLRVDGNSAFGDDFGLQKYPKLSAAWILSDYDFWPSDQFETFKLRAAVGESGKAPGAFAKLRTWSPVGGFTDAAFTPGNVGNSDVGPERTREYEVGFDMSAFTGRLGLEATYWDAETTDALVAVLLPPSQGFLASRTENVGTLANSGYEFAVNLGLVRTESIDWRAFANISLMDSEAVDLAGQEISADVKAGFREGFPIPSNFGRKVTNPDAFADPEVERDVFLGNVFPDKVYGFGTTLTLGERLTIDGLIEHQGGHTLPNYTGYQNARRGAWHPCFETQVKIVAVHQGTNPNALDDVTALERAKCAIRGSGFSPNSDFWVEDADFWKIRTLSMSWNVPTNLLRGFVNSATVTLAGRNLYTWTDANLADPEVEDFGDRGEVDYDGDGDFGRRDYYTIPAPRTFLLSFRVGF